MNEENKKVATIAIGYKYSKELAMGKDRESLIAEFTKKVQESILERLKMDIGYFCEMTNDVENDIVSGELRVHVSDEMYNEIFANQNTDSIK